MDVNTSTNSSTKRKPNWTEGELEALSQAVAENLDVIKGKFSPGLTNDMKNKTWVTITQRYVTCMLIY